MPEDCHFPDNDENDDSDMDFGVSLDQHSPIAMNTSTFYNESPNSSGDDESDDEAPDDISFETSKISALQEIKDAFESARKIKQKQKERRQRKQEFLAAQKLKKKQRLEELASSKLPDDILTTIATIHRLDNATNKGGKSKIKVPKEKSKGEMVHVPSSTNDDEEPNKRKRHRRKNERVKQLSKPAGELPKKEIVDVIPLDSRATEFHARVLDTKVGTVVAKSDSLNDLKNRLMFGKLSQREPTWKAMAKSAKQKQLLS